jgi:hypothetical protein
MRGQVGVEDLLGAAVGWPCWRFLRLRHGRPRPQHLLRHDGSSSLARDAGGAFWPGVLLAVRKPGRRPRNRRFRQFGSVVLCGESAL